MLVANYRPEKPRDPFIWIVISILLASVLTVYPLAYDLSAWRPFIMLLVMLFWVLCQPTWCGVWFAFGTGIFVDMLMDAPLGLNALCFVVISFVARFLIRERRVLTFANLWVIAALAILAYLFMMWVAQIMGGIQFSFARHWQPLLTSVLVWPLVYFVLKKWRV